MTTADLQTHTNRGAPRHMRLFELIRQNTIAARTPSQPAPQTLRETAQPSRTSLLPQEQQAIGITSSFGR